MPETETWSPGRAWRVVSPRHSTVRLRGMFPTGTASLCNRHKQSSPLQNDVRLSYIHSICFNIQTFYISNTAYIYLFQTSLTANSEYLLIKYWNNLCTKQSIFSPRFYCALPTPHVSAPFGGHLHVVRKHKKYLRQSLYIQRIR
jgi:hypothetical protein